MNFYVAGDYPYVPSLTYFCTRCLKPVFIEFDNISLALSDNTTVICTTCSFILDALNGKEIDVNITPSTYQSLKDLGLKEKDIEMIKKKMKKAGDKIRKMVEK